MKFEVLPFKLTIMYTVAFSYNRNDYRSRAFGLGLRMKPYTREEVLLMDQDQLDMIRKSVLSMATKWDEKEYAYFLSEPHIKLLIDSVRPRKKTTYIEAKESGEMEFYIMYHEQYQKFWDNEFHKKYLFADDYEFYLREETINGLDHAKALGMVAEYFSGIGIFPEVGSSRRVIYNNDYDLYIAQLTPPEYLELVSKYRKYEPAKYQKFDDPRTFIDTALNQVEKYVAIMQDLEEPIYIPGDGLGIGSYVARMLKKKYFSSEPHKIGYEARKCGLITSDRPFMLLDCVGMKTVFLANIVQYLDSDIYKMLLDSKIKICLWDEMPDLSLGRWKNGGDVRLWYNYDGPLVLKESKIKYERILLNLSKRFNLIPVDNLCVATLAKLRIEKNSNSPLIVCTHPRRGSPSYCILTRSFNFDLKNGRTGQLKDICGETVEWSSDNKLVDGFCGMLPLKEYEDKVIRKIRYQGTYFTIKERVPGYKRFVQLANFRYKVAFVGCDPVTKESKYMLNSDFGYRQKLEILDET